MSIEEKVGQLSQLFYPMPQGKPQQSARVTPVENLTHQPQNQGRRYWDEASTPLYPFGYGLSYTNFRFSDLRVDREKVTRNGDVHVSVYVTNTGKIAGDEVVQLYIHQEYGSASRPVRELKGFRRIAIAPRETRTVRFTLGRPQLRYWSGTSRHWVYEASTYDVWVGGDSTATLHIRFEVIQDHSTSANSQDGSAAAEALNTQ